MHKSIVGHIRDLFHTQLKNDGGLHHKSCSAITIAAAAT
jgi:hypothetical protein